ncbi:four helix bundle protein [Algoriphagus halophytocola]|uniref:Four helix bundle protein n=1 Tax=Algoriphagus halophytocola TaxID=2991499 RepID=A0ABY6MQ65_9BACT|nr:MULTISPECIES: four helix bundle protein [unclassified Algoriphagus]UZD24699.1 four helix bundle protein [Algoriphagus sp. TR-M5]WBL42067.1 four helix bundle protein [Algoriphagus sp. TR-M9]
MAFKFEKLIVWQKAMDLNEVIFVITKDFPNEERFNLISQMRRAADSVALNIAEGSTSQSNLEYKRFLNYSIRSIVEVVSALFIARRRGYILEEVFQSTYTQSEEL